MKPIYLIPLTNGGGSTHEPPLEALEHLAASLARQTSPRVQVALVDLLGGLREQRALEALKTLLRAPGTTPEVARRAQAQLEGLAL